MVELQKKTAGKKFASLRQRAGVDKGIKMSEMLGNQYFLARKYDKAAEQLQAALLKNPKSKSIRKKLIICYSQTGEIERALELFVSLIKEDVDFIINTDPIDDDCPCPELVFDLEKELPKSLAPAQLYIKLGILWLYCNLEKSIQYFQKAERLDPHHPLIKTALTFLLHRASKETI